MSSERFEKVAPVQNFPEAEARIRQFWKENSIFEKTLAQRRGGPPFVFYEGPPTANGLPHNGHVLTRVIKDLFPRYKTMRGYYAPRKAGWDTHGLPVEIEVEKSLRIRGKDAIREYGEEPFVRRCLENVFRYTKEWEELTEALGFWVDLENAYVTYHESFIESVWWALSELFKKGLLYQGHKVVWWWAQGGTALSAAEVGEGYKEVDDPSVYVRFPLVGEEDVALLVWTTTPWTLPSNMFAAVRRNFEYIVVSDGAERLIVAQDLLRALQEKIGRELCIERKLSGAELIGKKYRPPFDWFSKTTQCDKIWRVVDADFVELDAGTGIVHIAPAFGEADFEQLARERETDPSLELLCAVCPDGGFDPQFAPTKYARRWVKECDRDLMRDLKEASLLWHAETIRHPYPFCVRSDQDPLIQYARPAWYIRTTQKIRDAMANNQAIHWLPEHIQEGRFGDFLRNNVDWALSRERFWGTPLNVWINDVTGRMDAPNSVAEILERNPSAFEAFDAAREKDPSISTHLRVHKPYIDQVTWQRAGEPGVYRRVPEVIDCWFDSGSMPFAQWGYPHRGKEEFAAAFPADFISEAIDQTRGWFYSLLMVSTLLFEDREKPHPFRNCMVLGHVCDRAGKKESKSKGNYTSPELILKRVRLECAVVEDAMLVPEPGQVFLAREDYEGLDFSGEKTEAKLFRVDRLDDSLTVTVIPKKIPRRLVLLAPSDRAKLGCALAPTGFETRVAEVPQLEANFRVAIEDTATPAPGADAFRWFFYAANPPWNSTRHSLTGVRALQRELPLKFRNVYSFFTIYANIDGFDPADVECQARKLAPQKRALLDRWILSELALATQKTVAALDAYLVYDATVVLTHFVDALSNWYVRRSRDRFWAAGLSEDKLSAHWTLYECLTTLTTLLAPFLPFATEEVWQNLVRRPFAKALVSVHMADYPAANTALIDHALSQIMGNVRDFVSAGLQVRTTEKLRVRQPLAAAEIVLADPQQETALRGYVELIRDELNVHTVNFVNQADAYVTYRVQPQFRALGPRVGKKMPLLKQALQGADGAALLRELDAKGCVHIFVEDEEIELSSSEINVTLEAREGFAAASCRAGVIVLHTALTPELIGEGMFREILNRVQTFRKELDLDYTARVQMSFQGAPQLLDLLRANEADFCKETLTTELKLGVEIDPTVSAREVEIDGHWIRMGLRVVA